jgi:hypothetical protein
MIVSMLGDRVLSVGALIAGTVAQSVLAGIEDDAKDLEAARDARSPSFTWR